MNPEKNRVLIVDESSTIRNIVTRALTSRGYEVLTATDGSDALKKIPVFKPDLITSDVDMPTMNGYEFCKRLRSGEEPGVGQEFSETPFVVITATDTFGAREEWFDAGAADFILKPFKAAELMSAITKALGADGEPEFSGMKVLIAEGSRALRHMNKQLVERLGVKTVVVQNGVLALEQLKADPKGFDLLLTDYDMPEMNGLILCEEVRKIINHNRLPIVFLSGRKDLDIMIQAFDSGATDYLLKPYIVKELEARLKTYLSNQKYIKEQALLVTQLEAKVIDRNKTLLQEQSIAIHIAANLTENRDPETGKHTQRTQYFVELILRNLALSEKHAPHLDEDRILDIVRAAPFHDIGKIGIPDNVLTKPGPLTDPEFVIIKTHASLGAKALSLNTNNSAFFTLAAEIAGGHHEKWDGSGYPNGLKGEEISIASRAMALADVYDALTMKRVYKEAMPPAKAKAIITEGRGKHFDPEMVDIFLEKEEDFIRISKEYGDF